MSKVTEFLDKVMADEAAKAEFGAVIGVRKERELSDDDFQKIVELSEKLGASVTLDEVKDFFSGNGRELSEEELAGVAGGYTEKDNWYWSFDCPLCGETIVSSQCVVFIDGEPENGSSILRYAQQKFKMHLQVNHGVDKNIAEQKAEELMKPKWEYFVEKAKWLYSL